jgi:hypothetical protein
MRDEVLAVLAVMCVGLIALALIISFWPHYTDTIPQTTTFANKTIVDKWYNQESYFIRTSDNNVYECSENAYNKATIKNNYMITVVFTDFSHFNIPFSFYVPLENSTFVYDVKRVV